MKTSPASDIVYNQIQETSRQMAVIKPFRGVRYNNKLIKNMQEVVSQPYDRINSELEQQYLELSPYNISRIILGQPEDAPAAASDPYLKAKGYYQTWLDEQVLVREETPAFYAYEQSFTIEDRHYVRLGMIAAVKLAEFDEGIILPHERTHSGPKEDRLRLLDTLKVNTEQIFMLYPDPENKINALIRQSIGNREPAVDTVETFENDVRQRMWVITDKATVVAIQAEMAPKRNLIIADGHHRYETALNYRRAQGTNGDSASNYITATMVSMDDPGLVVLPTHREIRNFIATSPEVVLERAASTFDVAASPDLPTCLRTINGHPSGHSFGFYGGEATGFKTLTLKDEKLIDQLIAEEHTTEWKSLAVSVLHKILLDQIAEVPAQGIEDKSMIRYHRNAQEAVDSVDHGDGNFVFFVSGTRMEDIKACASQGEKMPQKSTDFYPKVISGLALMPVGPDEKL